MRGGVLNEVFSFLSNPLLWKVVLAYWLFNSLVDALPLPNGSEFYRFVYRFLHGVAGNLNRAAQKLNVPGAQQ